MISEIESRLYPTLENCCARLNAEFLNMLFDHKPSRWYMLTSEGSKHLLVYVYGALSIAGTKGLQIARHEREIIHRHRNCARLRSCFARDKEKTRDNDCKRAQRRHQKRIACLVSGTPSGDFPPKSLVFSNLLQIFVVLPKSIRNRHPMPSIPAKSKRVNLDRNAFSALLTAGEKQLC